MYGFHPAFTNQHFSIPLGELSHWKDDVRRRYARPALNVRARAEIRDWAGKASRVDCAEADAVLADRCRRWMLFVQPHEHRRAGEAAAGVRDDRFKGECVAGFYNVVDDGDYWRGGVVLSFRQKTGSRARRHTLR